jgi:hypothetical protein
MLLEVHGVCVSGISFIRKVKYLKVFAAIKPKDLNRNIFY